MNYVIKMLYIQPEDAQHAVGHLILLMERKNFFTGKDLICHSDARIVEETILGLDKSLYQTNKKT